MNPHNANYHKKIKKLENTIQQLEGRIRILTAGKQPDPSIDEQIAEIAEIHGTTDIELNYSLERKEWQLLITWFDKETNVQVTEEVAPTLDEVLENAKTLTRGS